MMWSFRKLVWLHRVVVEVVYHVRQERGPLPLSWLVDSVIRDLGHIGSPEAPYEIYILQALEPLESVRNGTVTEAFDSIQRKPTSY